MRAAIRAGQRFASRGILRGRTDLRGGHRFASSSSAKKRVVGAPGGRTGRCSGALPALAGLVAGVAGFMQATVVCEGKGGVKEQFKADSTGKEATGRIKDEYLPDHGPSPKNWKSWKNPQPPNIELYAETRLEDAQKFTKHPIEKMEEERNMTRDEVITQTPPLIIRGVAYAIDNILSHFFSWVVKIVADSEYTPPALKTFVNPRVATWAYFASFLYYNDGQTPGQQAMGYKVCLQTGKPISFTTALLRPLLQTFFFFYDLPFLWFRGISLSDDVLGVAPLVTQDGREVVKQFYREYLKMEPPTLTIKNEQLTKGTYRPELIYKDDNPDKMPSHRELKKMRPHKRSAWAPPGEVLLAQKKHEIPYYTEENRRNNPWPNIFG